MLQNFAIVVRGVTSLLILISISHVGLQFFRKADLRRIYENFAHCIGQVTLSSMKLVSRSRTILWYGTTVLLVHLNFKLLKIDRHLRKPNHMEHQEMNLSLYEMSWEGKISIFTDADSASLPTHRILANSSHIMKGSFLDVPYDWASGGVYHF